jgi:hypothetical protein
MVYKLYFIQTHNIARKETTIQLKEFSVLKQEFADARIQKCKIRNCNHSMSAAFGPNILYYL